MSTFSIDYLLGHDVNEEVEAQNEVFVAEEEIINVEGAAFDEEILIIGNNQSVNNNMVKCFTEEAAGIPTFTVDINLEKCPENVKHISITTSFQKSKMGKEGLHASCSSINVCVPEGFCKRPCCYNLPCYVCNVMEHSACDKDHCKDLPIGYQQTTTFFTSEEAALPTAQVENNVVQNSAASMKSPLGEKSVDCKLNYPKPIYSPITPASPRPSGCEQNNEQPLSTAQVENNVVNNNAASMKSPFGEESADRNLNYPKPIYSPITPASPRPSRCEQNNEQPLTTAQVENNVVNNNAASMKSPFGEESDDRNLNYPKPIYSPITPALPRPSGCEQNNEQPLTTAQVENNVVNNNAASMKSPLGEESGDLNLNYPKPIYSPITPASPRPSGCEQNNEQPLPTALVENNVVNNNAASLKSPLGEESADSNLDYPKPIYSPITPASPRPSGCEQNNEQPSIFRPYCGCLGNKFLPNANHQNYGLGSHLNYNRPAQHHYNSNIMYNPLTLPPAYIGNYNDNIMRPFNGAYHLPIYYPVCNVLPRPLYVPPYEAYNRMQYVNYQPYIPRNYHHHQIYHNIPFIEGEEAVQIGREINNDIQQQVPNVQFQPQAEFKAPSPVPNKFIANTLPWLVLKPQKQGDRVRRCLFPEALESSTKRIKYEDENGRERCESPLATPLA